MSTTHNGVWIPRRVLVGLVLLGVSGVLVAQQPINVAQLNGVATTMGNGVSGTGVQRVTLASDSTGQVTLATGSATIGALTANQSVNTAQINGVAPTMGNGVSGTGVQRVTLASDSTGQVALAAGSATIGALAANQSVNVAQVAGSTVVADPCKVNTPTYTPISITTATTTRIIAPTSAKRNYICALVLFSAGTNNVGVVEGTGGTCGTATAGIIGGTTAANGLNLTAQTGVAWGNGDAAIFATAGTNQDTCLITSAAVVLAGHIKWVAQ